MPSVSQDASGSAAYRPTSLDFINLPNPIEPHTQAQKHPLNGTPRLEKARLENNTNQDLFKLILEPCNERSPKRQKPADNTLLNLPKLPVRNSAKRLRIPPTLSGLHQPPPDAGLLPSISVEQPQIPPPRSQVASASQKTHSDRPVATEQSPATQNEGPNPATLSRASRSTSNKAQYNKWTDSETADLLKGVAQFGIGSWTKILKCADYEFHGRTALDLKDRFRVCCPDHYSSKRRPKKGSEPKVAPVASDEGEETVSSEAAPLTATEKVTEDQKVKSSASHCMTSSQLKDLGIDQPFAKSGRRSRRGYSEAEDEAILRGFKKYGKSWASIRNDPSLNLSSRGPRDVRDRMRTRFPEEYAKAGLVLREKHINKREAGAAAGSDNEASKESLQPPPATRIESTTKDDQGPKPTKKPPQHSIFTLDDGFLDGLPRFPDDEYMEETEPIILDRGILDWAPRINAVNNSGIDPLMTLKLPKPVPTINQDRGSAHVQSMTSQSLSLPSLATLLPSEQGEEGHLELPSLMHWNNTSTDEVGRSGHSILTMDEMLS